MAAKLEERQKLLVCGFVRNMEQVYKSLNIPLEINDIIYLYQRLCEEWNKKYSHPKAIIDETKANIKFIDGMRQTVFGNYVVEEGVFRWKLKIISFNNMRDGYGYPYIGIIENDVDLTGYQNYGFWDEVGCQLTAGNSGLYSHDDDYSTDDDIAREDMDIVAVTHNYECEWKKVGDILEIILDLDERTVRFVVNDIDCGVAFRNIKQTSYRLALTMDIDAEFQLLS